MSKYRAIVFDVDGTAVPNHPGGMPSQRLITTVKRYQSKIHLIAATGRPLTVAMPVIQALGLTDPCIVSGGTIIIDPTAGSIIKHTPLPEAAVQAVFKLMRDRPYGLFLRDERISPSERHLHPTLIEDLEIIFISQVPTQDLEDVQRELDAIPDIAASTVIDWAGNGTFAFNITHINATKEHAVADVLERLKVPKTAAIGIGDGDNDLHLFRSVHLKVAMGNAGPALQAAADEIAPTVDDDGLSHIIEKYAASS